MPETKPIRLYSKSAVSTDWSCPRKYWWNYLYNGKGIVSTNTSLELFMGVAIHDSMAAIALSHPNVDIDLIANTAFTQMKDGLLPLVEGEPDGFEFVLEQSTLVEGLVRGFYAHAWPRLIAQYPKVVMVEQPMIYKHDGLGFMNKPDLVLGDNEGSNWYIEYKSTSSKKEAWINSWNTNIQVHATTRAIEEKLGEPVAGVIVQGLYKGYESYGKQSSPFCYAYKRNGKPPFTKDEYAYDYKAGFKRYPTWELPNGLKGWLANMPANVLADQFPQTPPIFVNPDLVDAFFRQRAIRESEIDSVTGIFNSEVSDKTKQVAMDMTFPQRFDQCIPSFGRPCLYNKLCHSRAGEDPLASGFVIRDDSHQDIFKELL